jgi:hypothetical protein
MLANVGGRGVSGVALMGLEVATGAVTDGTKV